jgi:hypothetical protein
LRATVAFTGASAVAVAVLAAPAEVARERAVRESDLPSEEPADRPDLGSVLTGADAIAKAAFIFIIAIS